MQTGSVNDAVYSIYKYILINNLFVTEQTEAQDGSNDAEDSSNENNNKTVLVTMMASREVLQRISPNWVK
nr:AAC_HP1_G0006500.mRNA.1.CDS.1 [Saccharomyces cerevisiae]